MRIELLRRFVVIAEELNLTTASQKLFVAQPLLSKQLKQLEEEYGCKLLIRNTTNMKLTPEGEILYERAKTICEIDADMRMAILSNLHQAKRLLKLVIPPYIASFWFDDKVGEFLEKYPEIRLNVAENGSYNTVKYLQSGVADVAVAHGAVGSHIESNAFYHREGKFILAYSKKKFPTLVDGSTISLSEIESLPLYICGRFMSLLHASEYSRNLKFNIICTSDSLSNGVILVEEGVAVGLFPMYAYHEVKNNKELGLCYIDDDYLKLELQVLMAPEKKPDKMIMDLIESVSETLDALFE